MTKDRLEDLKAAQVDDDEFETLEIQLSIEKCEGFMDNFFDEVEQIRQLVDQIKSDTEQMKRTQSDILSAPATDEKLQQQLDDLMADIKKTSFQVRFRLKEMELFIEKEEQDSDSPAEVRIRRTQYDTILRSFVDVMSEYNKTQVDYRESCKQKIKRQAEIAGKQLGDDELEQMLEQGNSAVFTEEIKMVDTAEAKLLLGDIKARHEDIMKLENSIRELHDIFVDVAILIDSQGEMIDRIEVNVENAVEWVDRANADMKKARQLQKEALKKKLMMMLVGGIVGFVVLKYLQTKLGM